MTGLSSVLDSTILHHSPVVESWSGDHMLSVSPAHTGKSIVETTQEAPLEQMLNQPTSKQVYKREQLV